VDKVKEEDRSTSEVSNNDPVLNSIQPSTINDSIDLGTKELEERKRKADSISQNEGSASPVTPSDFTDKIVTLNYDGQNEAGEECKYYYVLKYTPDMFRYRLAPMRKCGVFGTSRPQSQGRPIWVLVDEDKATELDMNASLCELVDSVATLQCTDADGERWDIPESGHHMVTVGSPSRVPDKGTKVDINHGHRASASVWKSAERGSKLKLKRKHVVSEEASTEKPPYPSKIGTTGQSYVKESAMNSFTRLCDKYDKSYDAKLTVDKVKEEDRSTSEVSNNDPVLNSIQPSTINDSIDLGTKELEERKRKADSISQNEGSVSSVTPSDTHGGDKEDLVSKSTVLSVGDFTRSSDVDKVKHFNTVCARLDSSEHPEDAKKDRRKISLTSSNQLLNFDEKDEHQYNRDNGHDQDREDTASLSNKTLLISEDSNQTFSDVSCEMAVKECETKQSPKNRQMVGVRKRSARLALNTLPEVKQKTITSFFQCTQKSRS